MPMEVVDSGGGYKTIATGKATMLSGQTTLKVAHGLGKAPVNVIATPTTDPASRGPWVSSLDSDADGTKFTLAVQTALGANLDVHWFAIA